MLKPGLSAYLPVRNVFALDYCAEAAARSLLPICDELIICDSDSTDGTREFFDKWALSEPKLRVINYPWPDPVGDGRMLVKWLNWIRPQLQYDMQICTDADEVLDPKAYSAILECCEKKGSRWFHRLHFWKDAQHITQDNKVVGSHIARLGRTEWEMTSDEMRFEGEPPIRQQALFDSRCRFFHYGFLRKPEAFYAKSKVMQRALANGYDTRLQQAEDEKRHWTELMDAGGSLVEFNEPHPAVMAGWLQERGYSDGK